MTVSDYQGLSKHELKTYSLLRSLNWECESFQIFSLGNCFPEGYLSTFSSEVITLAEFDGSHLASLT